MYLKFIDFFPKVFGLFYFSKMLRSLRRFRTLEATLPFSVTGLQENYQNQLEFIKKLHEAEIISSAGGSKKSHELHASRNKVFGKALEFYV